MEKAGLVRRRSCVDDVRAVYACLTGLRTGRAAALRMRVGGQLRVPDGRGARGLEDGVPTDLSCRVHVQETGGRRGNNRNWVDSLRVIA